MIFLHDRTKLELFHDVPTGTLPLISEYGFINSDMFLKWQKHFHATVSLLKMTQYC